MAISMSPWRILTPTTSSMCCDGVARVDRRVFCSPSQRCTQLAMLLAQRDACPLQQSCGTCRNCTSANGKAAPGMTSRAQQSDPWADDPWLACAARWRDRSHAVAARRRVAPAASDRPIRAHRDRRPWWFAARVALPTAAACPAATLASGKSPMANASAWNSRRIAVDGRNLCPHPSRRATSSASSDVL